MKSVRRVAYILGFLYVGLAAAMVFAALVDLSYRNAWAADFIGPVLVTFLCGTMCILSYRREGELQLTLKETFLLTTLAWFTIPIFGALPLMTLGIGFSDAVFEAVSGLTTTGSTVLSGLDNLPEGILIWRSLLQWMGGVGIIVMAIVLLPYLRVGGMQLFRTESSEKGDKIFPRSGVFIKNLIFTYVGITFACILAYYLSEMSWFDAFNHALTTLSTGGYSTHDASFGYFQNSATIGFAIVFMLLGGLPFALIIQAVRGKPGPLFADEQVQLLAAIILLVAFATAVYLRFQADMSFGHALLVAAFNYTSIITTTGYAYGDYSLWGAPIVAVVFMLTFFGGCTGSTSGGIKMLRFIILWRSSKQLLQSMVRPHRVSTIRFNGEAVAIDVRHSVALFVVLYLFLVALLTVALMFYDLDIVTALSGAAQAVGNVGPGLGDIIGPAGNFASLPDGAKWLLAFGMLLGRLEIFTVLVILDPSFWTD
ncbi:trk system potassium uptake protein TrkH [Labrenzia sp. MBR-25]|jgi:trk system potassium uptake protein TrkH